MKGDDVNMAYTREQLKEDITENFKKHEHIKVTFDDNLSKVIIADRKNKIYGVFSDEDSREMWNEELCDRVASNLDKVAVDIRNFYKHNVGETPNMHAASPEASNMSLKIVINDKKILNYDLFDENIEPLNERQKMGIIREHESEKEKESSLENTARRITRNAKLNNTPENEVKEQIYELVKKYTLVENSIPDKTQGTFPWEKIGKTHSIENPSDISEAARDFPEVAKNYKKEQEKFDTPSEKSVDFLTKTTSEKDVEVENRTNESFNKVIDDILNVSDGNRAKAIVSIQREGKSKNVGFLGKDDRTLLQDIAHNAKKLGIPKLSEDIAREFSNSIVEYASIAGKENKTKEDIDIQKSSRITLLMEDDKKNFESGSMFAEFAKDYIERNVSVEKYKDGYKASYTSPSEKEVVITVPLKFETSFEDTFKTLSDTMKELPEDINRSVIARFPDGSSYDYSSRPPREMDDIVYRNTDSITATHGDSFATVFITRKGNPTMTFNTNDNVHMEEEGKTLYELRDKFVEDLAKNSEKEIPYEITISEDKPEKAVIIHDIPNQAVHYIEMDTFDKMSIKYDGARKNQEAQSYMDNILKGEVTTAQDAFNVAIRCDGKNSVVVKPSNGGNIDGSPITRKLVALDMLRHNLENNSSLLINIVPEESRPTDMIRVSNGEIVQELNPDNRDYSYQRKEIENICETSRKMVGKRIDDMDKGSNDDIDK